MEHTQCLFSNADTMTDKYSQTWLMNYMNSACQTRNRQTLYSDVIRQDFKTSPSPHLSSSFYWLYNTLQSHGVDIETWITNSPLMMFHSSFSFYHTWITTIHDNNGNETVSQNNQEVCIMSTSSATTEIEHIVMQCSSTVNVHQLTWRYWQERQLEDVK